jgi:hypothetical protein
VRERAKVNGRWHDHRHTLITDLAESGAGDETIMDIAGHVSKNMLKHYSHILDVATLADAERLRVAAGGILPRHATEPCSEVSPPTEGSSVADGRDNELCTS